MSHTMEVHKDNCLLIIGILWLAALILGLVMGGAATAHAQMMNEPWSFTQQNRASIAALIKQTEDDENAVTATAAANGYDQLICGGDGASSATGNATCIIMNNSDGMIEIGQDAQGNQDANNSTATSTINALSETLGSIGEITQ